MYIVILGNAWSERLYLTIHQHKSNIVFIWDMLTRRLYLTKISQTLYSLEQVDPKVVPHQNKSNMAFTEIFCTSPESVKCCVHWNWNMLTCRLYLPKISYALCSIRYVDPKVIRILVRFHQNKSSMVFIKILYVNPVFSGTSVTRSLVYVYVLQIFGCPFVLFSLSIVLSVLLRYTNSDYPFSIFKLFLDLTKIN